MIAPALPPPAMVERAPIPDLGFLWSEVAAGLEREQDPIEKRVRDLKEAAARKDILAWGRIAMPDKFFLPACASLHGYFVEIRHAELSSTVAPRGHAKTLVKCAVIPMFQALEEPKTYDYYLNIQATNKKGVAINFAIKHELETNEVLRAAYGDQVGTVKWTDELFMLKSGIVFQGAGAGDSIRGMQFLNRRPKYTIVDDLYDEDDIDNSERIEAKNKWYWSSLYPTRAKGKQTSFQTQGTAIGTNDIMAKLGEMAEEDKSIIHKEFAAYDPETGVVLWPELNSVGSLALERVRMGSANFDREMQGKRRNAADAIVKDEWLEHWEYDPQIRWSNFQKDFGPKAEIHLAGSLLGCDPSTGKDEGDPCAMAVVIVTTGPGSRKDWWIEDLFEGSLSFDARLAKLEELSAHHHGRYPDPAFRLRRAFVESIGGFRDFGNAAKNKTGLPVELVTWVKGKIANLASKSGHFEFGRVHISTRIAKSLRQRLRDQLTIKVPPKDDLRDSVLLCLEETAGSLDWV